MIIVREIRKVEGGFIVEARWPWGRVPSGYGEVVCPAWADVLALLDKARCSGDFRCDCPAHTAEHAVIKGVQL